MFGTSGKLTAIGAASGLGLGAAVALLAWFNGGPGGSPALQKIINYFGGLPGLYLLRPLHLPLPFEVVLFLIYWAAVGGVLGGLAGRRGALPRTAALILTAGLAVSHWMVQARRESEISGALRAVGRILTGGGAP